MNDQAQAQINQTTEKNGYIVTTRNGRPSFILPELARKLSKAQVNSLAEPEPVECTKQAITELKLALGKSCYGKSSQAKGEYLINVCKVNSFQEIEKMNKVEIYNLIEIVNQNKG